ncbi:hypothetical protein Tco_1118359 [Tanacetum coccineum]
MERVATTSSSLEAEQDSSAKLPYLGVQKLKLGLWLHLNKSYDPPLSRVNTLGSGEDSMKLKSELVRKRNERYSEFKNRKRAYESQIHDGNAFWNEIGVNAGVSKLMLLSLNLLLPVLVYAVRHSLTAVRHKLMLPGITYYCWIQALVDKKKVIITETSIRSDLKLDDAEETNCLPTATIFAELERMGYENLSENVTLYKLGL